MLIELEEVCRTVSLVLGRRGVKADDVLVKDLGAESIDILGVMVTLEEKYGVVVDEAEMATVATVRDLYEVLLESPHAPTPAADPTRSA